MIGLTQTLDRMALLGIQFCVPSPFGGCILGRHSMPTILTLNDDVYIAERVSQVVQAAGFVSLYTTDSYDALSLLLKNPIDLLIQDIARRDMDGFQFYRLMKSDEHLRDIPMILFTGYLATVTNVEREGISRGCLRRVEFKEDPPKALYVEGYLLVPGDFNKLTETIKSILEKCSRSRLSEQERAIRNQQLWSQPTW